MKIIRYKVIYIEHEESNKALAAGSLNCGSSDLYQLYDYFVMHVWMTGNQETDCWKCCLRITYTVEQEPLILWQCSFANGYTYVDYIR